LFWCMSFVSAAARFFFLLCCMIRGPRRLESFAWGILYSEVFLFVRAALPVVVVFFSLRSLTPFLSYLDPSRADYGPFSP